MRHTPPFCIVKHLGGLLTRGRQVRGGKCCAHSPHTAPRSTRWMNACFFGASCQQSIYQSIAVHGRATHVQFSSERSLHRDSVGLFIFGATHSDRFERGDEPAGQDTGRAGPRWTTSKLFVRRMHMHMHMIQHEGIEYLYAAAFGGYLLQMWVENTVYEVV